MSGLVVLFPIFSILLLADPNYMGYLFATSFVILSIFCSSFGSLLIRATSSIHNRHPIGSFAQSILGACIFFDYFLVYVIHQQSILDY